MDSGAISLGLMAVLGMLMIAAAISDLKSRTISNELNAAMALLAIPFWIASGLSIWPDVPVQFGAAFAVFLVFAGLFAIGAMGGGDVKLIGALALWLAPLNVMNMLVVMSLAGGALTLAFVLDHRLLRREGPIEIPYGVAIAFAGLLALREPLVNQFT